MLSLQLSPAAHVLSATSSICLVRTFPGESALNRGLKSVDQAPCLADSSTEAHEHQEKPEQHGFGGANVDKRQKTLLEPPHVQTRDVIR